MLIFDGHLDLSMNALQRNRDLTQPLADMNRREAGQNDFPERGRGTVSLPEMRRGRVGLCLATLIAHSVAEVNPIPGWHSPEIAYAVTQGQLAWYRAMERAGQMRQIRTAAELAEHVALWQSADEASAAEAPIGYVLSLEGADSILSVDRLHAAWEQGLRAIGPAHYGPGRYSPGTGAAGGLTALGRELLPEMERLGMCLDVTHLTDDAFWEALDLFGGVVWASHQNCRTLVPHQRQFPDEQLRAVIERGGVIGAACDAWMLYPAGWIRFETTPEESGVRLETLADHIDHVCQLAGNARHAAIGSDLDGGFGTEQTPLDLKSIADLQRLEGILQQRGYGAEDIGAIMHGNWIRLLGEALPE